MRTLISTVRAGRTGEPIRRRNDDSLGRGMELAITVLLFLGLGWLIDTWLGLFPVFTITLVVLAAIGMFGSMKLNYDAAMERHEAEATAARRARTADRADADLEDAS